MVVEVSIFLGLVFVFMVVEVSVFSVFGAGVFSFDNCSNASFNNEKLRALPPLFG